MVKANRFYVYAFLRVDKTPYYVGKGSGGRAYSKNRHIKKPKDKSRIVFLRTGLTEDQAFEWERFYIKHYGRIDLGTGILRNLSEGGDGPSGAVRSEETKGKIRKKRNKKIELTRMADGAVFVCVSAKSAARDLNLNRNQLSRVCQGKQYSTGGYLARYWSPDLKDWGKGLFHKVEEIIQKKKDGSKIGPSASKLKCQKTVELTGISDGAVFIFNSCADAARDLNLNPRHLSAICLGKRKSHKGFTARYL